MLGSRLILRRCALTSRAPPVSLHMCFKGTDPTHRVKPQYATVKLQSRLKIFFDCHLTKENELFGVLRVTGGA